MQKVGLILLFLFAHLSWAEQRIELQSTIVGNKELPTITYLLPWKAAKPSELSEVKFGRVLDQELLPLERELFQRELNFYGLGGR
ncbi:MAG: hypothetical protein Q9N68_08425 [Gammaproteobacteria bacterium]|nr:hypothetical protein [Gammaproteobacteria bacterium]